MDTAETFGWASKMHTAWYYVYVDFNFQFFAYLIGIKLPTM